MGLVTCKPHLRCLARCHANRRSGCEHRPEAAVLPVLEPVLALGAVLRLEAVGGQRDRLQLAALRVFEHPRHIGLPVLLGGADRHALVNASNLTELLQVALAAASHRGRASIAADAEPVMVQPLTS